jgi:hypothetical protein
MTPELAAAGRARRKRRAATDGVGLPRFIEREFRDFLGCGALGRGFARVRCDACRFERLVPFSCEGTGRLPELRRAPLWSAPIPSDLSRWPVSQQKETIMTQEARSYVVGPTGGRTPRTFSRPPSSRSASRDPV